MAAKQDTLPGFTTGPILDNADHLFGGTDSGSPDADAGIRRITGRIGPIAHMRQVHGNRVAYADDNGLYEEYDALITDIPGLWLCVKTADCVPILISTPEAVAAVHCGWRGLENGLLPHVLDTLFNEFNADPAETMVYIGPHIATPSYPVNTDVAQRFQEKFHTPVEGEETILLDLGAITRTQIMEMSISDLNIWHAEIDTYKNEGFNSHRRSTHQGNKADMRRNLSLITMI